MVTGFKLALWDIDGTLSDDSHRRHYFLEGDYARYFSRSLMMSDPVLDEGRAEFVSLARSGWNLGFVTARRERNRPATESWLEAHSLKGPWPLFMRSDDAEQSPAEFKASVIFQFLDNGYEVSFYEDDPSICVELNRTFEGSNLSVFRVPWAPQ